MLFGIRKKILFSGILTVLISILLISVIFIFSLIEFHKNNSKHEISLIHSNINSNFQSYVSKLNNELLTLKKDEKLVASLGILKSYGSINDSYFNELRQSLSLDLMVAYQLIDSDFMVIFDSFNNPVAFYNSSKMTSTAEECVGYASYQKGERTIYTKPLSEDVFRSKQTQAVKLDFFKTYLFDTLEKNLIVEYNDELYINIFKNIYNSSNEKVGTVAIFKLLDQQFVSLLSTLSDFDIILKYKNVLYAFPESLQVYKSQIEKSFFQYDESLIINNKQVIVLEEKIDNAFELVYLISFTNLEKELTSLKQSIIISAILILLLMLPFGYWFVKKYITEPIQRLLEDIKNFREKNQIVNKDIKLNDEFGVFQNVLYDMTNIILDKETELYLKSQEQKLANKELENIVSQLKAYQIALDETSIVSKSDLSGKIIYVNNHLCTKTGYSKDELLGKPHSIFKHPDTKKEEFAKLWATITRGNIYKGVIKNKAKDGSGYYVKTTIVPILDTNKNIKEYIAVRNDITDIMKAKQALEDSYYKDSLTSLPNRNELLLDLENRVYAKLALLNIDSFKEINDFYGHYTGDEILLLMSQKIKAHFNFVSKVYKMPSDEYALLFDSEKISDDDIKKELKVFIDEISDTYFSIDNIEISVNLTAGISLGSDTKEVLKDADIALKTAKKSGIFMMECDESSKSEAENYKNNILWAHKLKAAIKDNRIVPFYQAIYNNQTKKIEKYEVLMRLIDHNKPITPWFFLDIAKKTKLYKKLTKIMIEKSFAYFSDKEYEFSINLTAEDIESKEIKEFVVEQFEKYPNIRHKVVFEIVESEGFKNFDNVIGFIQDAKLQGCKIAIDDFGTGYSNFEYLLKLKADYVKIDGSLIKNISEDKDAYEVVKIITQFATSQGMKTIAEFVSSQEIQNIMIELGVDYSQGYFISEPLPTI